jgi:uroporphyrinogen decarboxylase
MLFSPRVYRELLMPCHKKVSAFCREHNLPLLFHCDGDVHEFIPLIMESGFDCIQPLEVRAGNDVRELKRRYGNKIVFFGNIGVDAMSEGGKRLEEEVRSKVTVAKEGGGYIYHSDHSVPPTVSLENYRRTIQLVREYGQY